MWRTISSFTISLCFLLLGVGIALGFSELMVRMLMPQPVSYFVFPKNPPKQSTVKRWGKDIYYNSNGYRDDEHQIEKEVGTYRIAVIGDSITYGMGVAQPDIYHQKVEQSLLNQGARAEVVAFNQGAVSTKWALKTYDENVRQFQPDLVVLGFCLNDIEDYRKKPAAKRKSTKRQMYDWLAVFHQRARTSSHLYFLIFERSRRLLYQTVLDRTVRTKDSWLPMLTQSDQYRDAFSRALESTVLKLQELQEKIENDGAQLLVVFFPFEMQLSPNHVALYAKEYGVTGLEEAPKGNAQRLLREQLSVIGIESLDLLPVFQDDVKKNDMPLFFRELGGMLDWAHPNERGHAIAGEAIVKFVKEKYLSPLT